MDAMEKVFEVSKKRKRATGRIPPRRIIIPTIIGVILFFLLACLISSVIPFEGKRSPWELLAGLSLATVFVAYAGARSIARILLSPKFKHCGAKSLFVMKTVRTEVEYARKSNIYRTYELIQCEKCHERFGRVALDEVETVTEYYGQEARVKESQWEWIDPNVIIQME